jgi:hypothetical protein
MDKQEEAYIQGFMDKCAQYGVDPETLYKQALIPPPGLNTPMINPFSGGAKWYGNTMKSMGKGLLNMSPAYRGAKAIAPTYGKGMGYAGKAMQSIGQALAPVAPIGYAAQAYGKGLQTVGKGLQGTGAAAGQLAKRQNQHKVPKGLTKLEPITIPIGKNKSKPNQNSYFGTGGGSSYFGMGAY